jgi:hypothetical protein
MKLPITVNLANLEPLLMGQSPYLNVNPAHQALLPLIKTANPVTLVKPVATPSMPLIAVLALLEPFLQKDQVHVPPAKQDICLTFHFLAIVLSANPELMK